MSLGVSHFEILERTENGWVRLALTGELDLASAPQLRDRLAQLAAKRSARDHGFLPRVDHENSPGR
jgi:anti-anti-sigma regulatory factor